MAFGYARKVGACAVCRKMLTWCDPHGRTCSSKCRQQLYRDRKKIDAAVKETMASMSCSAKTPK